MLYISRWVGSKVMVYDTDDSSETLCSFDDLSQALQAGLQINGVETQFTDVACMHIPAIKNVKAWQDPATCSVLQTKMSVVGHIDVTKFGRLITNIKWRGDEIFEPVSLRLSDFGEECADHIFYGNFYTSAVKAIVIFDDKIKFTGLSLYARVFMGSIGAMYDLREVRNEEKASIVYKMLFSSANESMSVGSIFSCMIDEKSRLARWRNRYMEGLSK